MATLADLASDAASRGFIGREAERELFRQFLEGDEPEYGIFNFWGHTGMGKSSLLGKLCEIANDRGLPTVVIDLRRQVNPLLVLQQTHNQLPDNAASRAVDKEFAEDIAALEEVNAQLAAALVKEANEASSLTDEEPEDSTTSYGELTGAAVGEVTGLVLGVPLLGLLGSTAGGAIGSQISRARLRRLVAGMELSNEEIERISGAIPRLTQLVLESFARRCKASGIHAIFFDQHEYARPPLDEWLCNEFVPGLDTDVATTVLRRRPLSEVPRWERLTPIMKIQELGPFTEAESRAFWKSRGIDDPVKASALYEATGGHPYKSDVLAAIIHRAGGSVHLSLHDLLELQDAPDVNDRLMERYLSEVGSEEERSLLRRCAVPRWFDRSLLEVIASDMTQAELYDTLDTISFIDKTPDGALALHSLAREAILKQQQGSVPLDVLALHEAIAEHLGQRRARVSRLGTEYLGEEIYHRLSHNEETGLASALAAVREARLLGLHGVEDIVWAEIAAFPFRTAAGAAWSDFGSAHSAVRQGAWNEALQAVDRLTTVPWPETLFGLWVAELQSELLVGRGQYERAFRLELQALEKIRGNGDATAPELRAEVLELRARHIETAAILSRFSEAFAALESALDDASSDDLATARIALKGAIACRLKGDIERGLTLSERSVGVYRGIGDARALTVALIQQARLETHFGRWKRALELLRDAEERNATAPDQYSRANVHLFRGNVSRRQGFAQSALDDYEESLALHLGMRSDREIAPLYGSLGLVHIALGDLESARRYLDESLRMKRQQNYRRGEGITLRYIGSYCLATGDVDAATEQFLAARAVGYDCAVPYLTRWAELGLTRCVLRGHDDPSLPLDTEPWWHDSDIRDLAAARALYEACMGSSPNSEQIDRPSAELAIHRLFDYNVYWAYEALKTILSDITLSPLSPQHQAVKTRTLTSILASDDCRALEVAAREREAVAPDVPHVAQLFSHGDSVTETHHG